MTDNAAPAGSTPPSGRSALMAKVKGKNTKPELIVRRVLLNLGIRYRLHSAALPGRPDVVISKRKLALFVHGCFWHRHEGCRRSSTPKTRAQFWQEKFDANVSRDARNIKALHNLSWNAEVIWECETRDAALLERRIKRILEENPVQSSIRRA